tara:strand:- start:331 stop:1200 length:870 start_codon:yes stop_codon:yes gene_type:complete
MNYNDITVGIVTFKSEKVLFQCLKSIKKIKKVIIFDNSNDISLKKKVAKIYPKFKFILSKKNLGYGKANNKIIKFCKSKYLFILNPDTILKKNCEFELLKSINIKKHNFSIIAPIANEKNYGFFYQNRNTNGKDFFEVDYVKGFAMLIDKKKIEKVGLFDKNIFLYLEEIDLCKRLLSINHKIYVNNFAKIIHLGARSTNLGFEFEKCRSWHWMWSNFYYAKKHNGYIYAILKTLPNFFSSFFKFLYYKIIKSEKKKYIYKMRFLGLVNSYLLNKSFYRPLKWNSKNEK